MFFSTVRSLLVLCILSSTVTAASAEEDGFNWPASCVPGIDCTGTHFRIGYPDVSGTGLSYSCGKPGYFGHQGTDIVVSSVEQGVHALAAADGIVRWTADGRYDRCPNESEQDCDEQKKSELPAEQGKMATLGFNAGNFVAIEHVFEDTRYLSLYAHLGRGSLKVFPGEKVVSGQPLGDVASSGNSQIPHLHFGVYKAEGALYRPVDPWKGACNTSTHGLWASTVPYLSEDLLSTHPRHLRNDGPEIYLQTIQRSLPKKLLN